MTIEARFNIQRGGFSLDVDFSIAQRGVTAIFGPSGSGKTTLLRALAGLEYSQRGYLQVGGKIWQNAKQFVPTYLRAVGYVFQEASLFSHLDVRGNIEYGVKRQRNSRQTIALQHAIDLLGIGHLLTRQPFQLSGGERQRVAIVRALATNPDLLLLDEPLAALDDRLKQEILPYLEALHRELDMPIVYVTHSRDEVARLADQLMVLENGRLKVMGQVDDIFSNLDFPLARDVNAESVIDVIVAGYDPTFGVNWLDFSAGRFVIAAKPLPVGKQARLRIFARDVSITLIHQQQTSILNIFPVTVDQLVADGDAQVIVRLMAGSVPLLSRITRKSAHDLNLQPGDRVFAQIKSAALLM